jgi:hypothetical protein
MTIHIGDTVRCPNPECADGFAGTAVVRHLGWPGGSRGAQWLQVERADGAEGGGDIFMRRSLWVIRAHYVIKMSPRGMNDPPTRYGPYVPIPKALP